MNEVKPIQKPLLVARQELVEKLVKNINESGVPLVVVHPLLQAIEGDVLASIQKQYEKEKAEYQEALKEGGTENGFTDHQGGA